MQAENAQRKFLETFRISSWQSFLNHRQIWLEKLSNGPQIEPFPEERAKYEGIGFYYKGHKFITHTNLQITESAFFRLSFDQMIIIGLIVEVLVLSLLFNFHLTVVLIISMLTILYFSNIFFDLFLIIRSLTKEVEFKILPAEIQTVINWPSYTILCPLYKEWQVLPQFIEAISSLDYPKDKLQVLLLLEEDDKETIEKASNIVLPEYFEVVITPDSFPKTKPKACNFGLQKATGDYLVIYDAEDKPEPLQLKTAVLAFSKAGQDVGCIQAKLNFYNPHQNLLTKLFTEEYSLWFDLILPGLQSIGAPIPLGGTSNHFRTRDIISLQGWDAFNVTEDCDLGIRLAKRGLKTAIVDSTTYEEANSQAKNWFWQRTRWIKGYIQTYLVHMRSPNQFQKSWSKPHLLFFQLVVGAKVLSMFINPFMWLITLAYFSFRSTLGPVIESFYPAPILYIGTCSLIFGNFLYFYYYMIGCDKRRYYSLIKYAYLIPFYWLFMSSAAWVAFYKLFTAPHHWSKTVHGLHLQTSPKVSLA